MATYPNYPGSRPGPHAATHGPGGSDPLNVGALGLLTTTDLGVTVQAYDADLAAIAALTTTTFGRSLLTQANASVLRSTAGLVIGTDVLAPNGNGSLLTGITAAQVSGVATTAGTLAQFAATTSAQLAGVLSDETGSGGGFVRATEPTIASPSLTGTVTVPGTADPLVFRAASGETQLKLHAGSNQQPAGPWIFSSGTQWWGASGAVSAGTVGAYPDDVVGIGYNQNGAITTSPKIGFSIESDFFDATNRQTENIASWDSPELANGRRLSRRGYQLNNYFPQFGAYAGLDRSYANFAIDVDNFAIGVQNPNTDGGAGTGGNISPNITRAVENFYVRAASGRDVEVGIRTTTLVPYSRSDAASTSQLDSSFTLEGSTGNLRIGSAKGGGLFAGVNGKFFIDGFSSSGATAGNLVFRSVINSTTATDWLTFDWSNSKITSSQLIEANGLKSNTLVPLSGGTVIIGGTAGNALLEVGSTTTGLGDNRLKLKNTTANGVTARFSTDTKNVTFGLNSSSTWITDHETGGAFVWRGNSTDRMTLASNGLLTVHNATASTSSTSGVIVASTGTAATSVGIGGGNIYTGGVVSVGATTASTSTATGALVVAGGAGIAGVLHTQRATGALTAGAQTLNANTSFMVYTNEGVASKAIPTLPGAAAGLQYTFVVQDTDGIRVIAASGDTIRIGSAVSAAAGNIENTNVGATITLLAINATEWIATASAGAAWTIDAP